MSFLPAPSREVAVIPFLRCTRHDTLVINELSFLIPATPIINSLVACVGNSPLPSSETLPVDSLEFFTCDPRGGR